MPGALKCAALLEGATLSKSRKETPLPLIFVRSLSHTQRCRCCVSHGQIFSAHSTPPTLLATLYDYCSNYKWPLPFQPPTLAFYVCPASMLCFVMYLGCPGFMGCTFFTVICTVEISCVHYKWVWFNHCISERQWEDNRLILFRRPLSIM